MVYVDVDVRIGGRGLARCGQKLTRGRGLKIHQIFADVLYGWSLTTVDTYVIDLVVFF